MIGRAGGGDDCGEKGNVSIAIDGLLCMDCGTSWSDVDIAEVGRLGEVKGHSVVIGTVLFFAEGLVFKGVSVGGVNRSVQRRSLLGSWGEDVKFVTRPDGKVSEKMTERIERGFDGEGVECLVGHAEGDSSRGRVLILLKCF